MTLKPRNSLPCRGNTALGLVDPKLELARNELCDARHHTFAGTETAHVDVAIIAVSTESMPTPLELAVQLVQDHIAQQR